MTIAEKIMLSADKKCFTFFREGLFYKCYNEDMMVFVQHIKAYKVSSKLVKSVGADVYSIGFPVSEVKKGSLSLANILEKIAAKGFELISENIVFWFNEIVGYRNRNLWIRYPTYWLIFLAFINIIKKFQN